MAKNLDPKKSTAVPVTCKLDRGSYRALQIEAEHLGVGESEFLRAAALKELNRPRVRAIDQVLLEEILAVRSLLVHFMIATLGEQRAAQILQTIDEEARAQAEELLNPAALRKVRP
jgi:allophanate hydrolase subunit 1